MSKEVTRIGKKAVSPLIATVLLIAFAVALGAVVMNWGRSYVETTTVFAEEKSNVQIICSRDIYLRFNDNVPNFLCYNDTDPSNSYAQFIVENDGTTNVEELQITLIGERGVNVTQLENISLDIGFQHMHMCQ